MPKYYRRKWSRNFKRIGRDKKELDLSNVDKGIYFITLEQNDKASSQKLIIR